MLLTAVSPREHQRDHRDQVRYRYGAVFLLVLALLIFDVLAPDAGWARAVGVALTGGALTVAVATTRERRAVRQARARVVAGGALLIVIGVATGLLSLAIAWAVVTVLLAAIPVTLGGGLLKLIKDKGVTPQAVAGALAIYLVVGLLFASVVAFVVKVGKGPYFAQGSDVTGGDRVYFSFTVLTTTGFGDYTAATALGHALAVLEMLTGQLYLVTVIGMLVGNFRGNRPQR